uniref:Putative ovule protein n=1 Tax=Solanum chacoense TaxID=4108 RepID=A0A0V0HMG8_SOLCH
MIVAFEPALCIFTKSTGYLSPPTNNRYHQVTLSTKARALKSPSFFVIGLRFEPETPHKSNC